jgi:PST family polysaccharide transporter
MNFFKKSFWTSMASVAYATQSLVTNKLFSIYFGPQGVTLLAHFQNIIAIFTTVPNDGINRGVLRFLSDPELKKKEWNNYFSASVILNGLSFFSVALFMFIFFEKYRNDFPNEIFEPKNLALVVLGIFFHGVSLFMINLILTSSKVIAFSVFSIANNFLGIGLIFLGIKFGIVPALIFLSFAPSMVLIVKLYYYAKTHWHRVSHFKLEIDKKALLEMSQFIVVAISGVALSKIVDFFVREYAISQYDYYETGLWQGVVKLSDGFSSIYNAAFNSLLFMKVSQMIHDKEALSKLIRKGFLYVAAISFVGLSVIWVFREQILILLYNNEFGKAVTYMDFQLIGDFFKYPSWILSMVLLAQLHVKTYMWAQIFSCVVYCILVWLLVPIFNLQGLPIAHAIRFLCYLLLLVYLQRRLIFH